MNRNELGIVLIMKNYIGGFEVIEDYLDGKIFLKLGMERCLVEFIKVYLLYLNFENEVFF